MICAAKRFCDAKGRYRLRVELGLGTAFVGQKTLNAIFPLCLPVTHVSIYHTAVIY